MYRDPTLKFVFAICSIVKYFAPSTVLTSSYAALRKESSILDLLGHAVGLLEVLQVVLAGPHLCKVVHQCKLELRKQCFPNCELLISVIC